MVDNFDRIRGLLNFRSDDEFYFLQILQRKKDFKETLKVNRSNNNSRLVKAYYVSSLEYFDFIKPEVVQLSEVFGARASINLNKRSYQEMALRVIEHTAKLMANHAYEKVRKVYDTVAGKYYKGKDKVWLLDVDEVGRNYNSMVLYAEKHCKPDGPKFIGVIPSKNGYHILMKPFDTSVFCDKYPDVEIHKNNPTNLYIP